ncbi:MAG: hypothetical protein ACUVSZ_18075 [Chloroflexus sp.]|uniref:hypothetical protein n=1 Tax=Chloroflexus sp. TaxID=1904827 RepID=UPI0040491FA6
MNATGVAKRLLVFQPLTGRRKSTLTAHRPSEACAYALTALVDNIFPEANIIWVVPDSMNPICQQLYTKPFRRRNRRIARRLEVHSTLKHGRWLNTVEIEFSILVRQCLDRRLPDIESGR